MSFEPCRFDERLHCKVHDAPILRPDAELCKKAPLVDIKVTPVALLVEDPNAPAPIAELIVDLYRLENGMFLAKAQFTGGVQVSLLGTDAMGSIIKAAAAAIDGLETPH